MIKVTVLYPNDPGTSFDLEYYTTVHIPMIRSLLDPAGLRRVEVDRGLGGAAPGDPPPFHVLAHLHFDSVEAFGAAFGPHADRIMADIPNYTDAASRIQVGEVLV